MATLTLTAMPGHYEDSGRGYRMQVFELLGTLMGRSRIEAKNTAEITALVKRFGDGVARQHPDVSFTVSVSVVRGSRIPNGFDATNNRDGFGQNTWMKTINKPDPIRPGHAATTAATAARTAP